MLHAGGFICEFTGLVAKHQEHEARLDALTDDDDAEAKLLEEYCFDLQVCLQCMLGCLLVSVLPGQWPLPGRVVGSGRRRRRRGTVCSLCGCVESCGCVQLVWLCVEYVWLCGVTGGCVCVRDCVGLCVAMWITLWT